VSARPGRLRVWVQHGVFSTLAQNDGGAALSALRRRGCPSPRKTCRERLYLALLEEAFLVAPLVKFSTRAARRRSSPPKLITLNNALLAVVDPRGIVDAKSDPTRFGAWVENACLAHAWNAGQRVCYWREEPLELDGVIEGRCGSWAIEVETGRFPSDSVAGLLTQRSAWRHYEERHQGITSRALKPCTRRIHLLGGWFAERNAFRTPPLLQRVSKAVNRIVLASLRAVDG